jgi:biotin transport system substrate-specific component
MFAILFLFIFLNFPLNNYFIPMIFSSISRQLNLVKVLSGVILIFAFAQITIPLDPIPITLQTLAVILIGLTYQMSEGLAAVTLYVVAGALGIPIFANMSSGFGGPSSGYLIGFIAAVYGINKFKERFGIASFLLIVSASILGSIIIFAFGLAWLSAFIGVSGAIQHGLMPFILPGIIKAFLLGVILKTIRF